MEGTRELAVGWEMQRSAPRTGGCWGLCLSRAREPRMDLEGKGGGLFGSTFEMPTLAQRGRSHRGCVRLPLRAEAGAGHVQNSSTWGGCGFKASERGQGHVEEESGRASPVRVPQPGGTPCPWSGLLPRLCRLSRSTSRKELLLTLPAAPPKGLLADAVLRNLLQGCCGQTVRC